MPYSHTTTNCGGPPASISLPGGENPRLVVSVHGLIVLLRHHATSSEPKCPTAYAHPRRHGRTLHALVTLCPSRGNQCRSIEPAIPRHSSPQAKRSRPARVATPAYRPRPAHGLPPRRRPPAPPLIWPAVMTGNPCLRQVS